MGDPQSQRMAKSRPLRQRSAIHTSLIGILPLFSPEENRLSLFPGNPNAH
jgi:hypothetical protein